VRRLIAQEGDWIERFRRADAAMIDINANVSNMEVLVLPSVVIGPYELADVPVVIPAQGESINISGFRESGPRDDSNLRKGVRASGVVGYEVLRHFVVTIDYDREKMHLAVPAEEPKAAAPDPTPEPAPEQVPAPEQAPAQ
jgi:hypothetical protein